MNTSLTLIAASLAAALTIGTFTGGEANATPLAVSKPQLTQTTAEHIYTTSSRSPRSRAPALGGRRPSNNQVSGPTSGGAGSSTGNWIPQRNPNIPDFNGNGGKKVHKKWHFHLRVNGGGRSWCHKHWYKVRGMRFHSKVRCGHRHYRAYRSWDFVY